MGPLHEDKAGNFARAIAWQEELAVQGKPVFAFENHLLRSDQRRRRELPECLPGDHVAAGRGYLVRHRRNRRGRAQAQQALSVARYDRGPLHGFALGQGFLRGAPGNCYAPQVTAIDVLLIRGEDHRLLIRGERDVFHIELAGGEQGSRAAAGRDRVQVIAAVLFGGEDDASVGREVQGVVLAQFRK